MSVKAYQSNSWTEISAAKQYTSSTWQDRSSIKVYENGAWNEKWSAGYQAVPEYMNIYKSGWGSEGPSRYYVYDNGIQYYIDSYDGCDTGSYFCSFTIPLPSIKISSTSLNYYHTQYSNYELDFENFIDSNFISCEFKNDSGGVFPFVGDYYDYELDTYGSGTMSGNASGITALQSMAGARIALNFATPMSDTEGTGWNHYIYIAIYDIKINGVPVKFGQPYADALLNDYGFDDGFIVRMEGDYS